MKKLMALLILVAGCASETTTAKNDAPAFELRGSRIIGCCCGTPCPCRLN